MFRFSKDWIFIDEHLLNDISQFLTFFGLIELYKYLLLGSM